MPNYIEEATYDPLEALSDVTATITTYRSFTRLGVNSRDKSWNSVSREGLKHFRWNLIHTPERQVRVVVQSIAH